MLFSCIICLGIQSYVTVYIMIVKSGKGFNLLQHINLQLYNFYMPQQWQVLIVHHRFGHFILESWKQYAKAVFGSDALKTKLQYIYLSYSDCHCQIKTYTESIRTQLPPDPSCYICLLYETKNLVQHQYTTVLEFPRLPSIIPVSRKECIPMYCINPISIIISSASH